MCELDAEAIVRDELAHVPKRRNWYAVVGSEGGTVVPRDLTDAREIATARAIVANADYPTCGPWHVVELFENLQVMP